MALDAFNARLGKRCLRSDLDHREKFDMPRSALRSNGMIA